MARPAAASPFTPDPAAERKRLLGQRGETLAARHLTQRGLVLIDRNWRCEFGEIDLVLRDGQVLVICEVKTRTSTAYGSPLEAVDQTKADRLKRLAFRWLREHDCHPSDVRVDVVGVLVPPGRPVEIEHVAGIG
jgi:putative endonuclease